MSTESTPSKRGVAKRFLFFLKFLEIRLRFIFILVVTALVVGYWDHIQNYYERWQRERHPEQHGHAAENAQSDTEYFCGMHPFVVRDRPGKCPICGMDLTPRKKGETATLPEGTLARVQTSPERIMQAGVQVDPALYRLLSRTVRSYGVVEVDETRLKEVVARFPGRVEDLAVNATGDYVSEGQALARIYSPEYLAGSDEYLRALAAFERMKQNPEVSETEKKRAERLVEGARNRLRLAGFTEEQLAAIGSGGGRKTDVTLYSPVSGTVMEKLVIEGQTVEEGTTLYRIAELSTLWVQILVIESDLSAVDTGMPVEVTSVSWPGEIFYGSVDFIYPEVNPENRSVKVRVVVQNAERKLKPGMYVNAVMRSPVGDYSLARNGETGTPHVHTSPHSAPTSALPSVASLQPGETANVEAVEAIELPTRTEEAAEAYLASLPEGATYYVCPMDPQVVSDDPNDRCPLCKMALDQAVKGGTPSDAPTADSSEMDLPTSTVTAMEKFLATVPPGGEFYQCPMDAQVVSNKADECPLCGMVLERQQKPSAETDASGGSYEQWAEGYACGMHPDELSDKPGVCTICGCGMEMVKWRVERVLSVPESAVIDTGMRKIIYVETEPGLYDARQVELGARSGHYYPVLAGLTVGEKVVTDGAFLIDAEARLNPAAAGVSAQDQAEEPQTSGGHQHER